MAFSPDGSRIVSVSVDKTLRIWDAKTGVQLSTLEGHSGRVRSVAFSPDGSHIASGSEDETIRIWDAKTSAHLSTLKGHAGWVLSVTFLPNGSHIASGSDDETVQLWDAKTGVQLSTLKPHSGCIKSVTFSPDGSCIVVELDNSTIYNYSVTDAKLRLSVGMPNFPTPPCTRPNTIDTGGVTPPRDIYLEQSPGWLTVKSAHLKMRWWLPAETYHADFVHSSHGNLVAIGTDKGIVMVFDMEQFTTN